jgi:transposase-like protein
LLVFNIADITDEIKIKRKSTFLVWNYANYEYEEVECSLIYSDKWKAYDGLVNERYKKHYRVKHSDDVFANGRAHVNGIENFWGIAKNRLIPFCILIVETMA